MAGLLSPWLGENPLYKAFDSRRNAIGQFGVGLLSARNWQDGLAAGAAGAMEGREQDDAYATQQKAEAERLQQINATAQFLQSKGYDDLLPLVDAGQADIAFNEALKRMQPQTPDYTAEQRNFMFAQDNPEFAQFLGQGAGADPTTAMQEYQFAQQQGYTGDFTTWKTDIARAGGTNIDMNNSQALAGGYADRMANANSILDDPKITQAQVDPVQATAGAVPGVGNFLTSNERKLAEQAQRDFVNAILRRESGAAIAESEFQNAARQYFPQPGDTPEVIEQKRRNREIAIQGVARAAGPSYQPPGLGTVGQTSSGLSWSIEP